MQHRGEAGTRRICGGLLLVLICGFFTACGGAEAEAPEKKAAMEIGEFVTNVRDSTKLLSSNITIDITDERMLPTLTERIHVARDAIVRILSAVTEEDLKKEDLQDQLAAQIVEALNEAYETNCVHRVYFMRFVSQ